MDEHTEGVHRIDSTVRELLRIGEALPGDHNIGPVLADALDALQSARRMLEYQENQ